MKATPIINNFTSGELSALLDGRVDIPRYANGAKTIENLIPIPTGGLKRRPGTYYVSEVKDSTAATRLIPFQFSTTQAYILEFGNTYIRFYKDGGQIDTTTATITGATQANPCVITSVNHPFVNGDSVTITGVVGMTQLNGNAYTVANRADDTFELSGINSSAYGAYVSGGTATRAGACEIVTGYATADLFDLQYAQDADTMYIAHPSYKTQTLTRTGHTNWLIDDYAPAADPFTSTDNYPACVTIHERRLAFANTNTDPQKVWTTIPDDFTDMTTGANDDDALTFVIGSEQVNAIRWLSSGDVLSMGTFGGVFRASGTSGGPLTPSDIEVRRVTTFGAMGLVPQRIGNNVYYVQRNSKILREFTYDSYYESHKSADLMITSDHISGDGISDIAYQQSPYNILWCVREDGQVVTLTRQPDENVLGWARHIFGGNFGGLDAVCESVACVPGDEADDQVWFIVKRTIDGSTVRYIEYLKDMDFGDEQEDAFFVDCGLSTDSPKDISGITSRTDLDTIEYATDALLRVIWASSDTSIPIPVSEYASDSYTKLLLHCDGSDAGTTFTDSGNTGHTVTAKGNAQLDTAQQKFGTASGLFDGTGDYLTVPDHADWYLADGDFTFDCWVRFDSASGWQPILSTAYLSNNNYLMAWAWDGSNSQWNFRAFNSSGSLIASYKANDSIQANTWYHVALVRDGSTFYFFRDGIQRTTIISTALGTDELPNYDDVLEIGHDTNTDQYFDGWIDELRVSKGVARWISDFNIPNLQCYSEGTIVNQGSYSMKIVARAVDSLDDTVTGTLAAGVDLSSYDDIKFYVRASRAGERFKIGFHDSGGTTTEHDVTITTANTWQQETVDISAVAAANKDDIDSVIITITDADAANTIYIDNIHAPTDYIVITATSHGYSDADVVAIRGVKGMTEINQKKFVVADSATHTFRVKDTQGNYIDGAGWSDYLSGGEARKCATSFSGLDHLEGETVHILADGVSSLPQVISSGAFTLDSTTTTEGGNVHAGLAYTPMLKTMRVEAGSSFGTAQSKTKRIAKVSLRVVESLGVYLGDEDDQDILEFDSSDDEDVIVTPLYSGDKEILFPGDYGKDGYIVVTQRDPLPLTIVSMVAYLETHEG